MRAQTGKFTLFQGRVVLGCDSGAGRELGVVRHPRGGTGVVRSSRSRYSAGARD